MNQADLEGVQLPWRGYGGKRMAAVMQMDSTSWGVRSEVANLSLDRTLWFAGEEAHEHSTAKHKGHGEHDGDRTDRRRGISRAAAPRRRRRFDGPP